MVVWICSCSRKKCFNVNNFRKILKKSPVKFAFYALITTFSERQFTRQSFLDICRIFLFCYFEVSWQFIFKDCFYSAMAQLKKTIETIGIFRTLSNVYYGAFWIVNGRKLFTICAKHSILDVWQAFLNTLALDLLINFLRKQVLDSLKKFMIWNVVKILKELSNTSFGTQILLKKSNIFV